MTEEQAATEPTMGLVAGDPLESLKEMFVDKLRIPFPVSALISMKQG
jgi:hypothetical protein